MGKLIKGLTVGLGFFLLAGCESGGDTDLKDNINENGFYARFDPANSVIPFPNNLLFKGTTDYTLNIPVANPAAYSDPKVAMNTLDGFSTTAPMTAQFSSAVDGGTVIPGKTVRVFEVNLGASLEVTGVNRELSADEYMAALSSADPYQTTLAVLPKRPLAPETGYVVVLTRGIKGQDGSNASSELPYALAKSETPLIDGSYKSLYKALDDEKALALEPLRQLTNATEGWVEAFTTVLDADGTVTDLPREDIVLSWSFRTQSIGSALELALDAVDGSSVPTISATQFPVGTEGVVPGSPGLAYIYTGTLDTEYFLTVPSASDPTAPLHGFWHNGSGPEAFLTPLNPVPVSNGPKTMPVLITVPKLPPADFGRPGGWPVVIFQHGITRNRTDLLAIADGLASAGFVGIAIDLPLHGITSGDNPFRNANENTFNLDFVNNIDGSPGPDGNIDESGTHFINLANLLVTRDNVRQGVVDLAALYHTIPQLDASLGGSLDVSQVYFIGHSLGGIVGSVFLHYFDGSAASHGYVQDAVLAMPGGGVAKLLDGSPTFGPKIAAGLANNGVIKGTPEYESFMGAAQTVVDAVDPLNYAWSHALGTGRGILLFEVVGGNSSLPDQVIPNNVLNTPGTVPSLLAGTDPMAKLMGLTPWNGAGSEDGVTADQKVWMRYSAGHHGSLLTPNDANGNPDALSADVYWEMLGQTVYFLATGGAVKTYDWNVLSSQ